MEEVINKLLSEKGIYPEDSGYEVEKERLTGIVQERMADAMIDAVVEEDRLKMLKEALETEPDNAEKIRDILLGSELKTGVLEEAVNELRQEYLEEK